MTVEEKAEKWIDKNISLGMSMYNPSIESTSRRAYLESAEENGVVWHDLRKDPNDLPKIVKEYITNIGVMTFDRLKDRHLWATPTCDACDYSEEVTDEVIAWCEIPQFKE